MPQSRLEGVRTTKLSDTIAILDAMQIHCASAPDRFYQDWRDW